MASFAEPQFELSEDEVDERTHVIAVSGEIHVSTAPEFSERLNDAIAAGQDRRSSSTSPTSSSSTRPG